MIPKFIEINTMYQGYEENMIINVDDIARILIGPNMIILRTSYTTGNNSVSVTSETISKLKKLLMTSEVTE